MELLEFARGDGLRIATAVFAAGLIWRLLHLYLTARKTDLSEARFGGERAGGIRTIFSRFVHHKAFRERTRNGTVIAYTFHIGLAIVVFGAAPHILFIQSFTGLAWPSLPNVIVHVAAAVTLAALFAAIFLLAVAHLGARYETLLAIHILSVEAFLVWFPFGKLMHSFIVFGSRYTTGVTFTRRGARV